MSVPLQKRVEVKTAKEAAEMLGRGAEGWRVSRAPRAPNMASRYKPDADRSPLSCPSKQDGRLLRPRAALAVRLEWAPSGRQPQR